VNEFVERCRREWKRLGVSSGVADEMATELAGDLEEGTPEEVLGRDAADAQSFARAWAAERGVIRRRHRFARIGIPVGTLASVAAAVAGAVLLFDASRSESQRLAVDTTPQIVTVGPQRVWVRSPLRVITWSPTRVAVRVAPPSLLGGRAADESQTSLTLGLGLLVAGLAGVVLVAGFWSARAAFDR
jgi:hypothetical protein